MPSSFLIHLPDGVIQIPRKENPGQIGYQQRGCQPGNGPEENGSCEDAQPEYTQFPERNLRTLHHEESVRPAKIQQQLEQERHDGPVKPPNFPPDKPGGNSHQDKEHVPDHANDVAWWSPIGFADELVKPFQTKAGEVTTQSSDSEAQDKPDD